MMPDIEFRSSNTASGISVTNEGEYHIRVLFSLTNTIKALSYSNMKYKTIPFIWENPEIQGINRLPMRPPLMPFPSPQEALLDAIAGPEFRNDGANPLYMTLDGIWRFKLLDNPLDDLK